MIEKHAQAALQAHLKLLRRQLEISSKGERMWETRCQETQKQLEIVQGELSKVKEEGDGMKSKIAELYNCKENLTKKLHEKVGYELFFLLCPPLVFFPLELYQTSQVIVFLCHDKILT